MADTSFVDTITLTAAAWFNDVNTLTYSGLTSVAGTNTITAAGPSTLTALAARQRFVFIPAATSTGPATLNITPSGSSALGAKNIFFGGAALVNGELKIGVPALVIYDGTQFNLVGSSVAGVPDPGSNGVLVRTALSTAVARTLTGTASRLSITNGDGVAGNPTLDIDSAYAGQTTIVTLGTVATGTWNATSIAVNKGGTGQTSYTDGQLLIGSTAGNTLAKATLTAPAAGITITNGTNSITFGLANDLSALEGLGSTGLAVRTGTDTWAQRSVASGSGITVSNGDGVAGNPSVAFSLVTTKGDLAGYGASPVRVPAGADGQALIADSKQTSGVRYAAALSKAIYGFTYANNGNDNIDIAAGGAMDTSGAYWMTGAASTKNITTAWAVGSAAGMLDTGAVGNNDYYLWAIARSDTGVVDYLGSLSSTAPTMPANYDFKRLIGWFKRVAGANVAFHTYETEGGGLSLSWDVPTLDVSLANTLGTARRTDAVKVPQNFSTIAHLNISASDVTVRFLIWVCCPDQTDAAPATNSAPLANVTIQAVNVYVTHQLFIRTSAAGLIASRSDLATVDDYKVSTMGFTWARRV